MKYSRLFVLVLGIASMAGCASNMQKEPPLPNNTVAAFVVTKNANNRANMVVITPKGQKNLKDLLANAEKKGPIKTRASKNQKGNLVQPISIELITGSCEALVCLPGIPCFVVIIDPVNDCPTF